MRDDEDIFDESEYEIMYKISEKKLSRLVYNALGEASMCWSETPKGVFDSTKAMEIGKSLIDSILGDRHDTNNLRM